MQAAALDEAELNAVFWNSPKILVVEDDVVDRRVVCRLLRKIFGEAMVLEVAENVQQALEAARESVFDIFIVDFNLDTETGIDLAAKCGNEDAPQIFILLTGEDSWQVDYQAMSAGFADYLVKTDLSEKRLERSLRYAWRAMRQKRLLMEQATELRRAKAEIEIESSAHRQLAEELTITQRQLEAALAEAGRNEARYRWLAHHDQLTELPNRTLFAAKLAEGMRQSSRSGRVLALCVLDLDRFKQVNDSYGHKAGDELLTLAGERMQACLRSTDIVARLAGDEFAIIMTNLGSRSDAFQPAQKIAHALSEPFEIQGHVVEIGVSLGIADYDGSEAVERDELLHRADLALYRAKESRQGQIEYYDEALTAKCRRDSAIKLRLGRAIRNNELYLVFQPKLSIATGRVVGMEALARWHDPELGQVSPVEFVPIAESTGLIDDLTKCVLKQALNTLVDWQATALANIPMAVNISATQLKSDKPVKLVKRLLSRYDVAPHLLELEITETAALHDIDDAVLLLNRLRDIGISVAIDDFGTGYSYLGLATRLPVNCLKIDRSFVAGMLTNPSDGAAVRATIALAHSLGMRAVGEGVETPQQLNFLKQHGCDEAQGYYIVHPLPAADLENWFAEREKQQDAA